MYIYIFAYSVGLHTDVKVHKRGTPISFAFSYMYVVCAMVMGELPVVVHFGLGEVCPGSLTFSTQCGREHVSFEFFDNNIVSMINPENLVSFSVCE